MKFTVGQKIWLKGEKKPYKVRACNDRFAICTKPFNLKRTCFYTIIDLKNQIRGTENVWGPGHTDDEECNECLNRLASGESEISRRNFVPLRILKTN